LSNKNKLSPLKIPELFKKKNQPTKKFWSLSEKQIRSTKNIWILSKRSGACNKKKAMLAKYTNFITIKTSSRRYDTEMTTK
jgi:hypothetical protein